jgi:CHAD domain-containing protein
MMYPISSKSFLGKYQRALDRVGRRVKLYLEDPDEDNIHDIRVTIRRLNASYMLLPKKIGKKRRVKEYISNCNKAFKLNSEVRDYDIIKDRLSKYSSDPAYNEIVAVLDRKRALTLARARRVVSTLKSISLPPLDEESVPDHKLQKRFGSVVGKLSDGMKQRIPIVMADHNIEELHELRKDCKKLRYLLEIASRTRRVDRVLKQLQDVQDILGSIHDNDIMIQYLRASKVSNPIDHIVKDEIVDRDQKYDQFVNMHARNLQSAI